MNWTDIFDPSFLAEFFTDDGKRSVTEKLFIVGVVWFVMGRKVATHFTSLEASMRNGFTQITNSVDEVRAALLRVESSHEKQLNRLTDRVNVLEFKARKTEEPKP